MRRIPPSNAGEARAMGMDVAPWVLDDAPILSTATVWERPSTAGQTVHRCIIVYGPNPASTDTDREAVH